MRIVSINSCNFGSTGNIMTGIAECAKQKGAKAAMFVPKSRENMRGIRDGQFLVGSRLSRNLHILFGKCTGFQECFSVAATLGLLGRIRRIRPDVVHLHNLHGDYINLPLLFGYIKRNHLPVVWTLHDCWALTGQCPYFTMIKCEKWKMGCHSCPQFRQYPSSYVDRTKVMWKLKKSWFTGIENMTIVTPSRWLADLAGESYLKEYPLKVINNGIDLDIFKPTSGNFRERFGISDDKYIVLFVAFGWGKRKGLDVVLQLAKLLDNERFQIVIVGTDETVDRVLEPHIISIHRTQNQRELAEIYTVADVFANPTREEALGMVNLEALACGTPVLTFRTGGSPETVDKNTGAVVECDDIEAMKREIERICERHPYLSEVCRKRAEIFDKNKKFEEYVALYERMVLN